MVQKTATFGPDFGLTPQLSARISNLAEQFESNIHVVFGERLVQLDSLIGLISMSFHKGDSILVCAEGSDAKEAVDHIVALLEEQ